MPVAETGLTRDVVNELLLANPAATPGFFCFRPSSKGKNTVVLCVSVADLFADLFGVLGVLESGMLELEIGQRKIET